MTLQHPLALAALPLLSLLVWLLERRLPARRARRIARWAVRTLLLACVLGALAGAARPGTEPLGRRLIVAVDRGARMAPGAQGEVEALLADLRAHTGAQGVVLDVVPYGGGGEARSSAAGLASAQLAFGEDETGGVLLTTDGRGDLEGVAEAAAALRGRGLAVGALPVPRHVPAATPRPRIATLDAPAEARGPFAVRVAAEATGAADLVVALEVDGVERARRGLAASEATFDSIELAPGLHELAVVLYEGDAARDHARTLVEVAGTPRIVALLADAAGSAWRKALSAQGLPVAAIAPGELAAFVGDQGPAPDLVLADAAALGALPAPAAALLAEHVRRGMGLLVEAGSSRPAWESLGRSPLAALLPLRPLPEPTPPPPPPPPPEAAPERPLDPPEPEPGPGLKAERRPEEALPITLLLVIDRSPSMDGDKIRMAIEGARQAATALSPWDRIGVVTFAHDSTLDLAPRSARSASSLPLWLSTVRAGGEGTNIYGALQLASRVLSRERSPILHLVLLTDGQQWPYGAIFGPVVKPMGARGVTITAIGIGAGANLAQLRDIVQWAAAGTVLPVADFADLPRVLTRDTREVAEKRRADAEALDARLRDPSAEPKAQPPTPPEGEAAPTPRPREPTDAPPQPPTPPTPAGTAGPAVLPLRIASAHEALAGFAADDLPSVGQPRRSEVAFEASVLLEREDGRAVLAAARPGVGRVIMWTLPPDDRGAARWEDMGRLFAQAARAVLAPRGSFAYLPSARVVQGADGAARIHVDWPRGETGRRLRMRWEGPRGTRDLGLFTPEDEDGGRELPAAPEGSLVRLHVELEPGPAVPPVSYLAAGRAEPVHQPADVARLEAALGAPLPAPAAFVRALPRGGRPAPQPLWPVLLWLAVALLPFDVWLHRRGAGAS
jgi:hypothetical protein